VFRSPRFAAGDPDWGSPDELDAHYAGFCAPLRTAASMLVRTKRYPLVDRDPMDRWASNRIAVLGDAAHPMLPVLAQGGCQAIEDAGALANSVLDNPDAVTALQDYERERVPRSRKVQMEARHFADICHIHGVGVELRNSLFRLHDPRDYRPLDWLYADRRVLS
jgi:salicylate hydroxylase